MTPWFEPKNKYLQNKEASGPETGCLFVFLKKIFVHSFLSKQYCFHIFCQMVCVGLNTLMWVLHHLLGHWCSTSVMFINVTPSLGWATDGFWKDYRRKVEASNRQPSLLRVPHHPHPSTHHPNTATAHTKRGWGSMEKKKKKRALLSGKRYY